MDEQGYINQAKEAFIDFCKNHEHLYIYGAGNYGYCYLLLLKSNGIYIKGFVVSKKSREEYCNEKVYSVQEIDNNAEERIGIIPAFTNSKAEEIQAGFFRKVPDIFDMEHRIMICLLNEIYFYPIMDKLDLEFGVAPVYEKGMKFDSILLIRLDAIGDIVFTTPFIRELRRNNPESHISMVIRKDNYSLLKDCPYIDKLFLYDSKLIDGELVQQTELYVSTYKKVVRFVEENFNSDDFDVVFFPRELLCGRNTIDELLLGYLSGAKYKIARIMSNDLDKRRLYERMRKSFSFVCLQDAPMHEAEYPLNLLEECHYEIANKKMELWPNEKSCIFAKNTIEEYRKSEDSIMIALGIVASVETRTWKADNYKTLIKELTKVGNRKVQFVLLGGKDAVAAAGKLVGAGLDVLNLTGKTSLEQSAAVVKYCDLYVGSNTGLLHFATSFGKPSVTIYSELDDGEPTDGDSPYRMGAWQVKHCDLIPHSGLDGCHGVCRMKKSHCINLITPAQVVVAVNQLINESK